MIPTVVDVLVVGGGIAGASLSGVLSLAGLSVICVEREVRFRDRVRGEFTWPWGVQEAHRLDLGEVLAQAGAVPLTAAQVYERQILTRTEQFPPPGMRGFPHPTLQDALFRWAESCGATMLRPAKAVSIVAGKISTVTVVRAEREQHYRARLVVGADGKRSAVRRWAGGETVVDPEHHRFGGVLLTDLPARWPVLADGSSYETGCLWFGQSQEATRLYLRMPADQLQRSQADRHFTAITAVAGAFLPEGALHGARQAGPLAFFPNSYSCVWASRLAGNGVVLIGDAAGSADPSWGRGTSLLYRDVRELSELLLCEQRWDVAIAEFVRRRARYYDVVCAFDRWTNLHAAEDGPEAERRRERRNRAKELDPTLGGFKLIEMQGSDGLVADEAARRHYFGEDLPGVA